ncbi:hypothetical protein AU196_11845 [Mycobacterium sp. IS-1742]|nr:hypothetical protein AU196_11845 [Mycobacterium sp. IS-1742]
MRMAFGAVAVAWTLALAPDLFELFGEQGAVASPSWDYRWSVLEVLNTNQALVAVWISLLLSALALTVGWHSRVAAVIVFILMQSFINRGRAVFNAGDVLLSIEALFIALSACGAAISLDQRRRVRSFWSAQVRAPWAIRLLQIQLSLIYLATVQEKLTGETWLRGTAVSFAWRADQQWAILPAPDWIANNAMLVNVASWATLVIELAIAVLVWNSRWRPWVLSLGVLLHLAILVNLNVGFFSFAVFILYLAFVPYDTVRRLPETVRRQCGDIVGTLHALRARRADPSIAQPVAPTAEKVVGELNGINEDGLDVAVRSDARSSLS